MNAERAEIFLEVVPVGLCKAARPVLNIEELWHVFIKQSDMFDEVAPHHHEARFPNEIRVESMLEPLQEEFLAAVESWGKEVCARFLEMVI